MKYYIGIDLGGTNVRTLLVDENGQSYSEVKDATERENGPDYVCSKIIRQIESLDCSVCGGIQNVQGIGIGGLFKVQYRDQCGRSEQRKRIAGIRQDSRDFTR